ncbi:MAG: phage tail protein, partial [Burkholderiaceae bacterium]
YTDRSKAPWRDAVASAQLPGVGTTLPRRVSQVRLPGVQRYSQAQREATERLNKLTLGDMSTTLDVFDLGIKHEVGDLIAVTHPVGLSAKPFRVAGPPQLLRAGVWRLELTEQDPAAYSNTVATAPSVPDTTLRNPAGPPAAVASLTLTAEDYGIRARWPASPESDVFDYELRRGTSWGAGLPLVGSQPTVVGSTDYLWPAQPVGSYTLRLKPLDNEGLQAAADVAATITITAPAITGLAATLAGAALRLVWAGAKASFAIAAYRVSWGAAAGANPVGDFTLAAFDRGVNWAGARTWWVQAIDVAGNLGPAQSIEVVITAPGAPTAPRVEVIDNNVLIFCSPPATGSLPVREYEVRKGASWAAGSVVGSNGNSTFFSLFEQAAGDYTYWIAARDTAGNLGAAAQVTAKVSQPPDYILRTNLDSTFGGTLTGCYLEGGRLIGPAFTTETVAQHFDARGWSAPQQQVDAGYPLYIQPAAASGTYVEDIDYGTLIPASTITITPTFAVVSGAPTLSVQIQYKAAAGDAWTSAAAGVASVLASAFRYVRVTLTLTANGGTGLIEVAGLNIKFAMKRRNDGGTYAITDANAGVWVPFGYPFIDADLPQCQPAGGSPLLAVIDFVDAPNPSGFRVYHYTIAGAKTTGTGSWAASGY